MDSAEPTSSPSDRLRAALKRSASALKSGSIPFALAGSYALWVHGAPENTHDVDLMVAESSTEDAARCLSEDGFTIERPPEDWLFKAHLDGAMVDVLHRVIGVPVVPALLALVELADVLGLRIPVLVPTDVISTKLRTLSERYCDFGQLLPPVRAVREQLDWPRLHRDCAGNPYARAFLFLATELGIGPDGPTADRAGATGRG
jgi:hypothetical protein